jgi:hypothetical protein
MSQPENQTPDATPVYGAPQQHDQAAEEPARLGPFARLSGTLLSPGETFVDVNRRPTWLSPLLIVMLIGLAATLFFEWRVKPDWDRFFRNQITKSVEKSGRTMTKEEMDSAVAMQVKFAKTDLTSPLSAVFTAVRLVLYTVFYCVLPAGIFALGLMLIQAQTTFKKILSIVSWSTAATGLVGVLVFVGALMIQDQDRLRDINPTEVATLVPTNLGVILPQDMSPFISSLIASIDIFAIWLLILLIIGFVAISGAKRITQGKVASLVLSLWFVWIIIKAGFAAVLFSR